ncbi:ABC transporter permease [Candidatus Woesearchaeota archaeon]|nr:ABC transporter permease [Candidatus Woesearchaeota archaeon]
MIKELSAYVLNNLWHRKLRSFLTIVSILIGITAIFALVSFGQGLRTYMDQTFKELGSDKLVLQAKGFGPPGSGTATFSQKDLNFVEGINGIDEVSAMMIENTIVQFTQGEKPRYVYVMGMPTDERSDLIEELFTVQVERGRELRRNDKFKAVVGYNYQFPEKVFKKQVELGDTLTINNVEVEVVGFYGTVGNPEDDRNIYVSWETAEDIFDVKDEYNWVIMRTAPGQVPRDLATKVQDKLMNYRGVKEGEEDFFVETFEDIVATFGNVILVLNVILFLIALISVVVAGVNIMNTMYTAVLERTKEIGIMKAVGAQRGMILFLFVMESGVLGLLGGIFGIFFGYLISRFGASIAVYYGLSFLQPAFPLWLTLGCLLFSFLVGAIAGLMPALRASNLNPVDALRYE